MKKNKKKNNQIVLVSLMGTHRESSFEFFFFFFIRKGDGKEKVCVFCALLFLDLLWQNTGSLHLDVCFCFADFELKEREVFV